MTKQFILAQVARSKQQLVSTFLAVPHDKLTWKPLDNGRSALDLFSEAANTFGLAAQFVSLKGEFKPGTEEYLALRAAGANWTKEEALAAMETNYTTYIAAWEGITDEDLQKPITMPFGEGMTAPFALWASFPNRTCTSRFAQINYIQTLYGDFDRH